MTRRASEGICDEVTNLPVEVRPSRLGIQPLGDEDRVREGANIGGRGRLEAVLHVGREAETELHTEVTEQPVYFG